MNVITSSHAGRKPLWFIIIALTLVASMFMINGLVLAQTTSIQSRLEGRAVAERANIKAAEIAKQTSKGEHSDKEYGLRIDIQNIEKIEGGVQIFARAWKGANQVGFGKDGSVEIERFRIFNPPVLIDDPNGDIVREWTDEVSGEVKQRRLREDPQTAILRTLAHTISIVGKDGANIQRGKVGNTTDTFFPSHDGAIYDYETTWNATVNSSVGENMSTTSSATYTHRLYYYVPDGGYNVWRSFFTFDTATIPAGDEIVSATLSIYGTNKENDSSLSHKAQVYEATPANSGALALADFDQVGETAFSTAISYSNWSTSGYNNFALNAPGIATIAQGSGDTTLSMTEETYDAAERISSSATDPVIGSNERNSVEAYFVDETGTDKDPKLVVEHVAPPSAITGYGVRKSVTQTVSSDSTTDDDSELMLGMVANSVFAIHGVIFASSTSQVPDIKVAFIAPTGAEMDIAVIPSSTGKTELLQTSNSDTDGIPIPANQPVTIQIVGSVKTGATGGDLKLQWAQNQADAAAVGVLRGSYLRADEI